MRLDGPRAGLQWPVHLDPEGRRGPTKSQARGPRWRRTSRGLYVRAEVERTVEQRIVEAAVLLPDNGGVQSWAALRWLGGQWFDGSAGGQQLPVTLATSLWDLRRQDGFVVCHERLGPASLVTTDGLRHVRAIEAVCHATRRAPTRADAVRMLDMACYDDLVSLREMEEHLATPHLRRWVGVEVLRRALPLADENSWSPRETGLRHLWTQVALLPPVLCNRPIFDLNGRHLATPDLFDPATGTAVEYNSELHAQGTRRRRDRDRAEMLRRVGIETIVVMAGDNERQTVERMTLNYRRRSDRAADRRDWTLITPHWWVPTFTVAQRRALTAHQRERWLAHRRLSPLNDVRADDAPA